VRGVQPVRVIAGVALAVCAVSACGAGLIYGSVPDVGNAPERVAAIDHAHGGAAVPLIRANRVARAIVAVEDKRFYEHGALDPLAIGRVLYATLTGSAGDPGGSTIALQLAKTLYIPKPGALTGDLRAVALAFKLERAYSKRAILSMYLNAIYFGHGYYGVEQASRGYFGRAASDLSWGQATLLAGLPQAPSAFDPFAHLARAKLRQKEVLRELVAIHALTVATARRVAHEPLHLRGQR
jgi:penicillin-binding protein 1A